MTSQQRNLIGVQVRRMRCDAGLSQPALAAMCQHPAPGFTLAVNGGSEMDPPHLCDAKGEGRQG